MNYRWLDCSNVEEAFYKKFGVIPYVRFHEGYFCLWKKELIDTPYPYYKLSEHPDYAISFINKLLIQIPRDAVVFENIGAKKQFILHQNQIEMEKICSKEEKVSGEI
jgi:hypothetical protein